MKAAIFDMDGTLLDSMSIWEHVGQDYLSLRGIPVPEDIDEVFRYLTLRQCAAYCREVLGDPSSIGQISEAVNRMVEDRYFHEVPVKADAGAFVKKLHAAGVQLCVATATDRYQAEAALRRVGLLDLFSFIITCNEAGAGKDMPDIYEEALRRLGTKKSETVVFEDALHAARTAKSAGFPLIVIHEATSPDEQPELEKLADQYIYCYAECEVEKL